MLFNNGNCDIKGLINIVTWVLVRHSLGNVLPLRRFLEMFRVSSNPDVISR
jgi:hypothetical protein